MSTKRVPQIREISFLEAPIKNTQHMQKRLLLGILPIFLSCNDSESYLIGLSAYPTIVVNNQAIFTDSIKLSSFSKKKEGYIQLKISSPLGIVESIGIEQAGRGNLFFNGSIWDRDIHLPSNLHPLTLTYQPLEEGELAIQFIATNSFQQKATATYQVLVFHNIAPIAQLKARKIKTTGSMEEWLLDGSGSYDPDYNLGGGIVEYEFDIEEKEIVKTAQPTANYAFESGQYLVRLRVKDNDGDWSKIVEKTIQINEK